MSPQGRKVESETRPDGLRGHPPFLARLTETERSRFLAICTRRVLVAGEPLFIQGDQLQELYIVVRGRLRVYYVSEQGAQLTFAYWTVGTLVGTPVIYHGFDHLWNADAVEQTELMAAPREAFVRLLTTMPSLALGVIEALEFKAKRLANLSQILATSSVPQRLKLLLLNLIDLYGRPEGRAIVVAVPFTHEEISGMVSSSRPWVSSMLARLKQRGLMQSYGRLMAFPQPEQLVLLDFDGLMTNRQAAERG